jgi:hypothetical protein
MFRKVLLLLCFQLSVTLGQTFNITKIDTTAFPLIKVNTLILTEMGNPWPQIKSTDFKVFENGVDLTSSFNISCPTSQPDKTANIVVAVEQSLDMKREVAKNVTVFDWISDELKYFFNTYQFSDNSNMALIGFNTLANPIVDFTNDKNKLINGLGTIKFAGATLYEDIFINQTSSAVAMLKQTPPDRHRIIIMITAKKPLGTIGEIVIQNSMKLNNCRLYIISVAMPEANLEMNNIALQSGGKYYEPNTKESLRNNLEAIKQEIAKDLPICSISWKSTFACTAQELTKSVLLKFLPQYAVLTTEYIMDSTFITYALKQPASLDFGPKTLKDTTRLKVVVTPKNAPMTVNNVYVTPPTYFSITDMGGSNPPFTLEPDESRTFTVQFIQKNSLEYRKAYLVLDGEPCPPYVSLEGGQESIKLDEPNGGQLFSMCEDIMIKWSGVDKYRNVRLSYSLNGGNSWNNLKADTLGGFMEWRPFQRSNNYKIMVSPVPKASYFWLNSFGGIDEDKGASIAMAKNSVGYYVTGSFIDKIKIGNYNLTSGGRSDIFIAKFDTDGNCLWAINAGGPNDEVATGITVDDNDNSYVCGTLRNGAKIGSMTFNTYSADNPYSCVIKLNPKGLNPSVDLIGPIYPNPESEAWANKIGYSGGKVYLQGEYIGNIDKDKFRLDGKPAPNHKVPTIFTAIYDTTVIVDTLYRFGSNYNFYSKASVTSADNFRYDLGSYMGTKTLDDFTVKSKGLNDVFVSKYGTKPTGNDISDTSFRVQGPILSIPRDTVDFGSSLISDSIEISFDTLFCNVGTHNMQIDSIKITGTDSKAYSFPIDSKQIMLLPGYCHTFPIQFKPFKLGLHNAVLSIWGECKNLASIRLLGIGDCGFKGKDYVDLDKVYIDSARTISIDTVFWNINNIPLSINLQLEGVNADEFTISPIGPRSIKAGEALKVNIGFKPKDKGIRNATINYNIKDTNCIKFETNLIGEGIENIIGVKDYTNENINSIKIVPNPAENIFHIYFSLKTPEWVSIILYNSIGESITSLLSESLIGGMYNLEADTPDIPNGVYYLRIKGSSTDIIEKLIINR